MTKTLAADLKPGDVILPPARELRLWMRRTLAEKGLPESALHITVTSVEPASPDRRGAWMIVRGHGGLVSTWAIHVRPATPWPVVQRANAVRRTEAYGGWDTDDSREG